MTRYEFTTVPFNHLFDSLFSDVPALGQATSAAPASWAQFRVKRRDRGFLLEAELAGVKKEDLKIEVLGDQLKISGHRGSKEESDSFAHSEFSRSFTLGKDADPERIEAKFENGFLTLLIPQIEAPKARLIDVK